MASYNTSEFKKGLKIQIDGDPYLMIECNFVKPGKGQALYKCRVRNLVRGTVIDRTWKSGDSVDAADISEIEGQFLYRQGEKFVFMDTATFEQYELTPEQVGDAALYLKDATLCSIMLFDDTPITVAPPNHIHAKVVECDPGVKGNTATKVTKPVKIETGATIQCPAFVEMGDVIRVDTRTGEYIERVKE